MEKISFETEDGVVDFFILSQTRVNGRDYLLVSESDDEDAESDVFILKDTSEENDTEAVYEFLEDDEELEAVFKVFVEELSDEDVDLKQ